MNNYFSKRFFPIFLIVIFLTILALPYFFASAQVGGDIVPVPGAPNYERELIDKTVILEKGNLVEIIFKWIRGFLVFLGVIAIIVIIVGGFTWMTAGGNDEKVKKAREIIKNGLIGLIIILLAYTIAVFVINRIHQFAVSPPPENIEEK